jgi:YihY family inner membrane protein
VAVVKKYGDDEAGHLAALVAYYAFFAIFPLLLVLVTLAGIVLRQDEALRQRVLDSAFAQFPVLGTQLSQNISSLHRTGLALVVGLVWAFLGARGMAGVMQGAANAVWGVPHTRRPRFPMGQLRSLALLVTVGLGLLSTTLLSGLIVGPFGGTLLGVVAGFLVSLLLGFVVFFASFRLATAREITAHQLVLGALVASVGWQVLTLAGSWVMARQVSRASDTYGTFAVVIGLITWLYLAAVISMVALEIDVVRDRGLWPRSLFNPPLTDADEQTFETLAEEEQRADGQTIDVSFDAVHPRRTTPAEPSR